MEFSQFCIFEHIKKLDCKMKNLLLLFCGCLVYGALAAQTSTAASTISSAKSATITAKEVLDLKETAFDFGKLPQGRPVTHVFDVVNNGVDSLKITDVQASCGCTTPDWETDKVQAPGQKTQITVGYNAATEGPFNKTITITYNNEQTKIITITGQVWPTPTTSAPENKMLHKLKDF